MTLSGCSRWIPSASPATSTRSDPETRYDDNPRLADEAHSAPCIRTHTESGFETLSVGTVMVGPPDDGRQAGVANP